MTRLSEFLYYLTVHIPLRIIEIGVNFLALFKDREHAIEVAHKFLRKKVLIGVLPDGQLLIYPLDDRKVLPIISEIYYKKIYDVKHTERLKLICDVGAHIGLFTLRISKQAPNSQITAIEPNPINYELLVRNISINGLTGRVHALNVAIGEKKEKSFLFLNVESRGDGSMKRWHYAEPTGALTVQVVPLDEILSIDIIYDIIKIDVEGMESEVLRGFEKQYMRANELVIEIHTEVVQAAGIYTWLHNHDFAITKVEKLYDDCLILEAYHSCV